MAKPTYKYKSMRGLECAVYNEQIKEIEKKYGKEVAEKANLGWGVGGGDDSVSVATKVYRAQGTKILTTNAAIGDTIRDFDHNWSTY